MRSKKHARPGSSSSAWSPGGARRLWSSISTSRSNWKLTLRERGKTAELDVLRDTQVEPGSIVTVRQQVPLGLGHAIWCARAFIGDDPFAILLPDDLVLADKPCLSQLADVYRDTGGNVVAVTEVPREQTNRYGILRTGKDDGCRVEVLGLVEKPAPKDAPSNLSIIGRYVLMPEVITYPAAWNAVQVAKCN